MMKKLVFVLGFICVSFISSAQDQPVLIDDSTFVRAEEDAELFEEISELNPQRAALLSAILPGMGQVYNSQYWKVPIVLAGVLTFGHFINYNNKVYHGLRNAALLSSKGLTNPYASIISTESSLVRSRDVFRRNRDFLIILGSAFYILQIVDAHVSAHLEEFKINDKLAFGIEPSIQSTPLFSQAVGVSFVLKF
ncbi:DUF5683 domain-containing protein [Ekhidna sp. To15]|uniref:DUF5683 domain-containing protein n=1 Tax=Ekhidna sp. To15 TaxID=3395267 RepID=UPI003F523914